MTGEDDARRMLAALLRGADPGLVRGIGFPGPDEDVTPVETAPAPVPTPPRSPRFDVSGLLARAGVVRLAQRVDVSSWGPGFWAALEELRHHAPATWPDGVDLDVVDQVVGAEGLPLVGVPRAGVVVDLLAAGDRAGRVRVLLAREGDVLADCRDALRAVRHPQLSDDKRLARAALDAFDDGHHEAAASLAAAVGVTALTRSLRGSRPQVPQQVLLDPDLAPYTGLRLRAALAPLLADPPPPGADRGEALVAVAVVCSAVRALAELRELVDTAQG